SSRHLFLYFLFFFFNDPAPPQIYTLSLHDALPISSLWAVPRALRRRKNLPAGTPAHRSSRAIGSRPSAKLTLAASSLACSVTRRSEEHTSELQSRSDLVCRLLLEKKNKNI